LFDIAETAEFRARLPELPANEQRRIRKKLTGYVYPLLRANPISGPNIKCLTSFSPTTWRYRIGAYRVFYEVRGVVVFVLTIKPRKDAYR